MSTEPPLTRRQHDTVQALVRALIRHHDENPTYQTVAPFIALLRQWELNTHATEHKKNITKRIRQAHQDECTRKIKARAQAKAQAQANPPS